MRGRTLTASGSRSGSGPGPADASELELAAERATESDGGRPRVCARPSERPAGAAGVGARARRVGSGRPAGPSVDRAVAEAFVVRRYSVNFGGHKNFIEELCTELKDGRSSVD